MKWCVAQRRRPKKQKNLRNPPLWYWRRWIKSPEISFSAINNYFICFKPSRSIWLNLFYKWNVRSWVALLKLWSSLFGYAQNNREEFLLLRLFKCAITNEVEQLSDVNEFLKGNPVFIRLGVHYNRGAKERAFLRNLLQPLVKSVLEDDKLDLDTDPLNIYRNLIRAEESKTGQRSSRPFDISKEDALAQEDVKQAFVERLKMLGDITSKFLTAIIASLKSLPYGLRYISGELVAALKVGLWERSRDTAKPRVSSSFRANLPRNFRRLWGIWSIIVTWILQLWHQRVLTSSKP